jgi:8-oxo-dGTP diphosphatase
VHYTDFDTRVAAYAVIVDDQDRILLTWFNGEGRATPGWSLPGGGVDYGETVVDGLVREVHEEAGYDVEVGDPLTVSTYHGEVSALSGRPFRAVRILYAATIVGGELGTTEVGGSTDFAEWVPIDAVAEQPSRASIVDLAVSEHRRRSGAGVRGR